jgi:hypothetical protein
MSKTYIVQTITEQGYQDLLKAGMGDDLKPFKTEKHFLGTFNFFKVSKRIHDKVCK